MQQRARKSIFCVVVVILCTLLHVNDMEKDTIYTFRLVSVCFRLAALLFLIVARLLCVIYRHFKTNINNVFT